MSTGPMIPDEAAALLRAMAEQGIRVSDRQFDAAVAVLLADYERRGGIEQRAREVAEANTSSPTKNPVAIRAARYILGETTEETHG